MGQPAVFLDRDGVLIEEVGYPTRPEQIRILAGVARGLARLAQAGLKRIVVTNQSGIARGLMTEADLDRFHDALDEQLDLLGAGVDAYYACPHHPDASEAARKDLALDCACRKPKPGLLLQAAGDLDLDLGASWLVGDTWRDIQAGQAAGVRTIKLPAAPSHDARRPAGVAPPDAEAESFEEAVAFILGEKPLAHEGPPEHESDYLAPGEHTGGAVALAGEHTGGAIVSGAIPAEERREEPTEPAQAPPAPAESPTQATAAAVVSAEAGPARPEPPAVCARCGQAIAPAAVASGMAGRRDGRLLCHDCLAQQPPEPEEAAWRASGDTGTLLYAMLKELRRLGRSHDRPDSLSRVRLFAYVLEALAVFAALWGVIYGERETFLQAAIFLQLLVLTLLLFERKS